MPRGLPMIDDTERWMERDYRRVDPSTLADDHPVAIVSGIYHTLPRGRRFPKWDGLDILEVPPPVVSCIALGEPVYASAADRLPGHYIYGLAGATVLRLVGRSMVGRTVGGMMSRSSRGSLCGEISSASAGAGSACSSAWSDLETETPRGFDRGVFLFEGEDGRIAKLLIVLVGAARPATAYAETVRPIVAEVAQLWGAHKRSAGTSVRPPVWTQGPVPAALSPTAAAAR